MFSFWRELGGGCASFEVALSYLSWDKSKNKFPLFIRGLIMREMVSVLRFWSQKNKSLANQQITRPMYRCFSLRYQLPFGFLQC